MGALYDAYVRPPVSVTFTHTDNETIYCTTLIERDGDNPLFSDERWMIFKTDGKGKCSYPVVDGDIIMSPLFAIDTGTIADLAFYEVV